MDETKLLCIDDFKLANCSFQPYLYTFIYRLQSPFSLLILMFSLLFVGYSSWGGGGSGSRGEDMSEYSIVLHNNTRRTPIYSIPINTFWFLSLSGSGGFDLYGGGYKDSMSGLGGYGGGGGGHMKRGLSPLSSTGADAVIAKINQRLDMLTQLEGGLKGTRGDR